jgi:hypothetical protein
MLRAVSDTIAGIASPHARGGQPLLRLVLLAAGCMALYGAAMGTYEVWQADRWKLAIFGAVKSPLLLLATSALVMPGFLVLNSALGLRDDLGAALRAVLASQAGLALALLSLAPVTLLAYFSRIEHNEAILFNACMFTLATIVGQVVMLRWYRPLIARNPRHRLALLAWLVLYAFVGMQTGWMLRPFIGGLDKPPSFLRDEPFSNAYIAVWGLLSG